MQPSTSLIDFTYADGKLSSGGSFDYNPGVSISQITLLGGGQGGKGKVKRSASVSLPLTEAFETQL